MILLFQLSCLLVLGIFIGVFIAAIKPINYWLILGCLLIGFTVVLPVTLEKILNVTGHISSKVFFSLVAINLCYSILLISKGWKNKNNKTIICGVGVFVSAAIYIYLFQVADILNSA